ncbi:MAG: hypothetical protein WEA58_07615 [Balneolaceae bacterium]
MIHIFSIKNLLLSSFILLIVSSCEKVTPEHWSDLIPDAAPFVIVPQEDVTILEILDAPYSAMFDDISPSAFQLAGNLDELSAGAATVDAMILFTDTSNNWQPVWITQSVSGMMNLLKDEYQKEFDQNRYKFDNHTIEKLYISDRILYIVEMDGWTIFSESSFGIESMIRTLNGEESAMPLSDKQLAPGSFIVNTPSLDTWVQQLAQVTYRPFLSGIFDGSSPASLRTSDSEDADWSWQLSGRFSVEDTTSILIRGASSEASEFTLDRFIPINSAAFSILRLDPKMDLPTDTEPFSPADEYIAENADVWRTIANQLNSEIAVATFAESGATSSSEYMFLRRLSDATELRNSLNQLEEDEIITREDDAYLIESKWLGQLIGSEINTMGSFYLYIHQDVAIMSRRKSLAESVSSDVNRRGVMYYDDDYRMVRENQSNELSSITYMNARPFSTFIQPWLDPQGYFGTLASNLDLFVVTTEKSSGQNSVNLSVTSYQREYEDQPYREQWTFPLGGADISGVPILADISGSSRNEVIFSTKNNSVYALATDGTVFLETSTEDDEPIGPPVVYDWYGNNQQVIMQAAGRRIYAWNSNGNLLPNFPIELNETITTPITVTDVTQNGVAEVIVGTADRRLHILNSRGRSISGWPQSTNSTITNKPLLTDLNGQRSIFVSSENIVHSWEINGQPRDGFPVFLDTEIHGAPTIYENHILSAGLDGNLYAMGTETLFDDSLSTSVQDDSLNIQTLQVSSSRLNAPPTTQNLMLRNDDGFFSEDVISLQSSNGSLFLYNTSGELRFTSSMGQSSTDEFTPVIIDIDRNQRMDVVALADFGRLYAWDILGEARLSDLPTTGMNFPLIGDLTGDGNYEIIAQTRDGLRAWTILQTTREEE